MRKAVFAGSFDPITLGHERLLQIASNMFDEVIIALCINEKKQAFFTIEKRIKMLEEVAKKFSNVRAVYHDGMLMDLLKQEGALYNIRGIRGDTDFEYENKMLEYNKKLYPEHITIYVPSEKEFVGISSTIARENIIKGLSLENILSKEVIAIVKDKIG